MAMIKVHNALAEACPEAELLLQVHDELLISAPEHQAEKAAELLRSTMENVFELKVPLEVSTAAGKTYFDVK
jgi:DNA polymerase-1